MIRKFQVEVSHLLKFVCYLFFHLAASLGLTMSWGMVSAKSRIGRGFCLQVNRTAQESPCSKRLVVKPRRFHKQPIVTDAFLLSNIL